MIIFNKNKISINVIWFGVTNISENEDLSIGGLGLFEILCFNAWTENWFDFIFFKASKSFPELQGEMKPEGQEDHSKTIPDEARRSGRPFQESEPEDKSDQRHYSEAEIYVLNSEETHVLQQTDQSKAN